VVVLRRNKFEKLLKIAYIYMRFCKIGFVEHQLDVIAVFMEHRATFTEIVLHMRCHCRQSLLKHEFLERRTEGGVITAEVLSWSLLLHYCHLRL